MVYHGDIISYIKETPDVLSHIYDKRTEIIDTPVLSEMNGTGDIVILGTGSSYNAGIMVRETMQSILKRRVLVIYPSELDGELRIGTDCDLVIGISQQGTSVSVIEALDIATKHHRKTIAMTGEEGSEITNHGDDVVMIECGVEDAGATTKGFLATAYTLLLFALEMANKKDDEYEHFERAIMGIPKEIEKTLDENQSVLEKKSAEFWNFHHLMIITSESYRCLLNEIVLKFSETCRKPVSGMDSDAFCHGMYNAVQESTVFLLLGSEKQDKMKRLEDYYINQKKQVVHFKIKEMGNDLTQLFAMMFCIQYLFARTSEKNGVNVNVPKDPEFHNIMGSKIEK